MAIEEPLSITPETIAEWVSWVEHSGEGYLVAEGAYVKYGMPCRVLVRRSGSRFAVSFEIDGDGMGGGSSSEDERDREGLDRLLAGLCRNGRPVLSRRGIDARQQQLAAERAPAHTKSR